MKTRILALSIAAGLLSASAFGQVIVQTPAPGATPVIIPGIPAGAAVPQVIATVPTNGDVQVSPNLRAVKFTFSEPMDTATFYWPLPVGQADFPRLSGDPYWENNNQTVVLPVVLTAGATYRIPLNQGNQVIFRSAKGVPAYPGVLSFRTAAGSRGSAPSSLFPGTTPFPGAVSGTPRGGSRPGSLGGGVAPQPGSNLPSTNIPPTMVKPMATGTPQAAGTPSRSSAGSSMPGVGGARTRVKTPRPTMTSR